MAGLGAFLVGGAVAGLGENILVQAKAKREAAMRLIEEQRQDARTDREMKFRSDEAKIGRDAQSAENEKERSARSKEAALTRENQGEYSTTADGTTVRIQGDKATPVNGPDGKPIKLAGQKGTDKPAEVATAEWLIQQGVAKDPTDAWRLVRSARDDPEKSRAGIYKSWLTLLKPEFGNVDPAKIQEEAMKRTDETMRMLDGDAPASPDASTAPAAPANDGMPDAPRQPENRVIGRVYKAPDGRRVKWMGNGAWEVVP